MPDEIANDFDLICIVFRNLNAGKFIFDQYHQLNAIEPVQAKILTEMHFIHNSCGINAQMLGNELSYFVGIKIRLRCGSLYWAQAAEGHNDLLIR